MRYRIDLIWKEVTVANPRTPRRAWIDEGLRALAAGGPDAVRVEALAQALHVTKGGFYGYFADRSALLTEMLDTWEREVTDSIIERTEQSGRPHDPRERIRRLIEVVDEADDRPATSVDVELAIRDWGRRDPEVARRLRRVDQKHLDYLRELFGEICADPIEAEARCVIAMSTRLGDHLMPVIADGHAARQVREQILDRHLL
jgi:AcrR family transcriptional regulator